MAMETNMDTAARR